MNTSDRSLKHGPSIVTKMLPSIFLVFWAISMGSKVKEDAEEEGECKECTKRFMRKGLFFFLQVV